VLKDPDCVQKWLSGYQISRKLNLISRFKSGTTFLQISINTFFSIRIEEHRQLWGKLLVNLWIWCYFRKKNSNDTPLKKLLIFLRQRGSRTLNAALKLKLNRLILRVKYPTIITLWGNSHFVSVWCKSLAKKWTNMSKKTTAGEMFSKDNKDLLVFNSTGNLDLRKGYSVECFICIWRKTKLYKW